MRRVHPSFVAFALAIGFAGLVAAQGTRGNQPAQGTRGAQGTQGGPAAQGPDLNLKLGLWEMSVGVDLASTGVDLSKLPADQRAQMESIMRGGLVMAPMGVKQCMTKEKLATHSYTVDKNGLSCKQTVIKATPTMVDLTQVCTGPQGYTNNVHIEAPTPTGMTITNKLSGGPNGSTSTTTIGKWIAADCGDVK